MDSHTPIAISESEWKEIMQVTQVREGWGLAKEETVSDFRSMVYGVKFEFMSGSPGYCGDLYIIQGDALEAPIVLLRKDGAIQQA